MVSLLTNILSRHYEFQADDFAVGLGHAQPLSGALKVLDKKNKSASNVDPWCARCAVPLLLPPCPDCALTGWRWGCRYSTLHHSHPPLVQRLEAISSGSKKQQ